MEQAILYQVLWGVLGAVAAGLGVLAAKYLKAAEAGVKAQVGVQGYELAKDIVESVVHGIEQSPLYKELAGPAKKERALEQAAGWLQDYGFQVKAEDLDSLIEACVRSMKMYG